MTPDRVVHAVLTGSYRDVDAMLSDPRAREAARAAPGAVLRTAVLASDTKDMAQLMSYHDIIAVEDWDMDGVLHTGMGRENCVRDLLMLGVVPDPARPRPRAHVRELLAAYASTCAELRCHAICSELRHQIANLDPEVDFSFIDRCGGAGGRRYAPTEVLAQLTRMRAQLEPDCGHND